jgi:hypothetical protein
MLQKRKYRDDDSILPVMYHESYFELRGGKGDELARCYILFGKSHWRINYTLSPKLWGATQSI